MAEKYTGKIDRNTDWGGDASTGYLPVAGSSVQEFIKSELGIKIGAVYKPEGSNFVYYFANDDDKAAYIETGDESLITDKFEMASKYDVKIDSSTLVLSHSVIDGTTGLTADFGFKIVDDNDMTADAKARIEFSFTGSGISNKFTTEIPVTAGDWTRVSQNIDNYLRTGANSLAIKITGLSTQATTQFVMTYNLFNLSFTPSFGFNTVQAGNTLSIPYIIECSDTKYLEFYIDGESVESSESMVIPDIRWDSRATLDISYLSEGQHTLQVRAYVKSNDGTKFYTPNHYYTFAKAGQADPSFLMYTQLDNTVDVFEHGDPLVIPTQQFTQISFDWSIYDYLQRKLTVCFEYEGELVSSVVVDENGSLNTFSYRPMDYGEGKTLRVYAEGEESGTTIFEHEITLDVEEAIGGVKETTDGMLLKLQATGRRNDDDNKDKWECIGSDGKLYYATFNGFAWNSQQGWNEETESLVISNGATVDFNIQPMLTDWVTQGGTVEVDLETFDIENEDAVICECANNLSDDEAFFRVTATKAELSTANHVSINTRYKDNERLKIAFIGNKAGTHDDGYLIYIVINGVLERAALYKDGDSMFSYAPLSIGNPSGECKVRLRSIRVYDRAISVDQAFNNYVVDSDNVQEIYEKNNVLKAGSSTEIGFDEVANKLPVMIFTGDMQDLVDNGQDKEWRPFDVEYINRQEPERNFVTFNCRMKLQGTSSLGYPRKNFKLNTKDKYFTEEVYDSSKYELDPNSVVGNLMLRNKVTGEQIDFEDFKTGGRLNNTYTFTLDYQGKPLKKGKYRFRKDAHKAQKWTLKADFMESSCSHNVGAGRSWNDIFENTPLLKNGDASYTNNTYKDSALISQAEYIDYIRDDGTHCRIENNTDGIRRQRDYVCRTDAQKRCISAEQDDIRTAVDGFPMVCFYRTSHAENNLIFLGQYNFINDKSSYEVFGFEDIEAPEDETTMIYDASKVECWEGLKNTNPLSLFITDEGFYDWNADRTLRKWQETYEARYPDPDDVESDPSCLYELTKWIVSTRHVSGETEYSGTIDIDASFAKRINTYQYGYTEDTATGYTYAEGVGLEDNAENRQKKFETEKWEHFDVWKLAGYYVYLMRYGAVDQFVKNSMLFTDGNGRYDARPDKKYRKWFFLNYDNDCLFGLRNNGQLAFHWDLDRQTKDNASDIIIDPEAGDESGETSSYAMMGHDSTLWNNLEADDEFMRMVRDLDYSMTKYKLNYDNMVKEFDTDQTERWCERIYNANEQYKYVDAAKGIGDMAGKPVDNLWMLQGTRRSHRHWWIANHFNLLDAQWLSGEYKNTYVEIKTNCPAGVSTRAKAGAKYFFAWGQQKKIYESNMVRNEGEDIVFTFDTGQSQGDPVYIYAFNKMSEMDFSELARDVFEGSFKFVLGTDLVQNTMKKLVIGNPSVRNTTSQDTTTWANLPNLEYIDITNFEGITSLPFKSFNNLHVFKASGTRLGAFDPAAGSSFTLVELPQSLKTLGLTDVTFNGEMANCFKYTVNTNLDSLTLANNAGVSKIYYTRIIRPWLDAIEASAQSIPLYGTKSLTLKNVDWNFDNLDDIRIFKNIKTYGRLFQISGKINLSACGNLSMDNIEEIKSIFGENCFNEKLSPLYVITPESVFIRSPKTEMVAGKSNTFSREIYPDERAVEEVLNGIKYYIVEETEMTKEEARELGLKVFEDILAGINYLVLDDTEAVRHGLTLENTRDSNRREIGVLRCTENVVGADVTIKVLVHMDLMTTDIDKVSVMDFKILDPTYVYSAAITGAKSLYRDGEYTLTLEPKTMAGLTPIGSYNVTWSLTGEGVSEYIDSASVDPNNQLKFIIRTNQSQPEISSRMVLTANIVNADGTTAQTSTNVLALNETVIMTSESNPVVMAICHNAGWAPDADAMTKTQAENVSDIENKFAGISDEFGFPEFVYFTGVTQIPDGAFSASSITDIVFPNTVRTLGKYSFDGCASLTDVLIEGERTGANVDYIKSLPAIEVISEGAFRGCSSLSELTLPEQTRIIEDFAFGGTGFRKVILKGSNDTGIESLRLSTNLERIEGNAFETESWGARTTTNRLTHLEIPEGATVDPSVLKGKYYVDFVAESNNGNNRYMVDEMGALLSKNGDTLLRYPPRAPHRELYQIALARFISPHAFFAVENLDALTVADVNSVQVIQEGFCMMSNITTVDLSRAIYLSNGEIPNYAFCDCKLLEKIYFPNDTITKIGIHAFENCLVLDNFVIPSSLQEFGAEKVNVYTGETLDYTYERSLAINNCPKIERLVIPNGVKKIPLLTINNCQNLVDVVFPAYLNYTQYGIIDTEQGRQADFGAYSNMEGAHMVCDCPNITGVTLPAFSIDAVDETTGEPISQTINRTYLVWDRKDMFPFSENLRLGTYQNNRFGLPYITRSQDWWQNLDNLKEFRLPAEDNGAECVVVDGIIYNADKTRVILCPIAYPRRVVLPSTLTSIGGGAYGHVTNIGETLSIPDSVETIGRHAFSYTPLKSFNFPNSLKVIRTGSFAETELTMNKLALPKTLQSLESEAFGTQPNVTEFEINSNANIGGRIFGSNLHNIEKITIKGNVNLESFAFYGCHKLKTIVVSSEFPPLMETPTQSSTSYKYIAFSVLSSYPGSAVADPSELKILVTVGNKDKYLEEGQSDVSNTTKWWRYMASGIEPVAGDEIFGGYEMLEEIPLSGYGYLTLYVGGLPYENIVYATSSLGHLHGEGGSIYSTTKVGDTYLFELDGLYDGEEITLYSDAAATNEIGRFTPYLDKTEYQSGEPSFSAPKGRALLLGTKQDDEIVSLTRSEYDTLTSKVNQMMRIINKMMK